MQEYIFTFGCGQKYENGFHAIQAESPEEARKQMFEKFGTKWSMQYNPPNARDKAGVHKYNLTEIK